MKSELSRQVNIQRVFLFCALALIAKAAELQIFDDSFRRRADQTTIEELTVYPPRGLVYDRHGELIINNEATYDLMVTYNQVDLKTMNVAKFCSILDIKESEFKQNLTKDWKSGKYSRSVPFVFMKKLAPQTYARLQESMYEFPGFFVQVRNIRGYPHSVGAHVLGYINEVDQRDIERSNGEYETGDYIGAAGIEAEYESYLKGEKGVTSLLRDNLGRIVGKYKEGALDTAAIAGHDLYSSIDINLQEYGEHLMQNKTGSVVALDPKTGQILCMISGPTYDPNLLVMTQDRGQEFSKLLTHPLKYFFDRTVMAKYPPGSIFKAAVSLAGMQEGVINPNGGFSCSGGYFYAGRLYKCHHSGHLNGVVDAIAHSCNTYYMNKYRDIVDKFGYSNPDQGLDLFNKYLTEFGFGQKLGIDYPNESPGSFPTSAYYNKLYPKKLGGWHSPTIMSCGIGQGELQLTTLQMANFAACIANRGYWYAPHLAMKFKDETPIPERFEEKHIVHVDKKYFDVVVEGMAQCVIRGTARIVYVPDLNICGKTGTSQNPHGDDHSVFFAFAPKDDPKIAIAVYVENAGWGSSYAAPIAGLMIERFLNDTIADNRKYIEERMVNANLIDKFLKNKPTVKTSVKASAPKKSEPAPEPVEIPSDQPESAAPIGQTEQKQREKK
ncbi:MAG: penicillin-binding protein 2 [Lewinellaceae bacterium]|nr:penicillin-binding protein 2 [Saprospiraceae bacterium]MCB9344137.1 penicillin-binding protein 2 [Lewinellaceae bacterium]